MKKLFQKLFLRKKERSGNFQIYYAKEIGWEKAYKMREIPKGICLIKIVDEDGYEITTWTD